MATLTVAFRGVCSHFLRVVPGVPHRVVLPDASAFQFGLLDVATDGKQRSYFTMPHLGVLRSEGLNETLTVEGLIDRGNLYNYVHLALANATDPLLTYDDGSFDSIPRLADFMQGYAYSDEVVLGGRAICYFDVHAGAFTMQQIGGGDKHAVLTVQTDGPPQLVVTPFFPDQSPGVPQRAVLTLGSGEDVTLTVGNVGYGCQATEKQYDYLLHYLTAKGGIPRVLEKKAPGMTDPESVSESTLVAALTRLMAFDFPYRFATPFDGDDAAGATGEVRLAVTTELTVISPSCSNSQYP